MHVEVEHNVDLLDVDIATEDFSGYQNTMLELLEALINFDVLFLGDATMDSLAENFVLVQFFGKFGCVLDTLHEDNHLVEFYGVDQVNQLLNFFIIFQLDVILLKIM